MVKKPSVLVSVLKSWKCFFIIGKVAVKRPTSHEGGVKRVIGELEDIENKKKHIFAKLGNE